MSAISLTSANTKKAFGKEVEEVHWQEGIGEFAIRFDNFTTIPWILPHWLGEKKKRVEEISEWASSRTFMKRAWGLIKNNTMNKEAAIRTSGEELLKFLEINSTQITKSLNNDPQNAELRTQLVQRTLDRLSQKGVTTVKQYRTLFLQALMANCFGEVSTDSLLLLKKVQDLYYAKSRQICRERIEDNQPDPKDPPKRKDDKLKIVAVSTAHANIIDADKKYLDTKLKRILALSKANKFVIRLKDLQRWNPEMENADVIKKRLISNTWTAIQFMRCFPLLHENAQAFADEVRKMDPHNPIGFFLKGYITVAEADLLIMAYRRGFKPQEQLSKIQEVLKTALHYYEQAIGQIQRPYSTMDLNILYEYTNILVFIENLGKMGRPTPRPVMEKYLTRAKYMLINAYKQTNAKNLKSALNKVESISFENSYHIF